MSEGNFLDSSLLDAWMDILGSNCQRYIEIQQVIRPIQFRTASEFTLSIKKTGGYGDLKEKCILRLAKPKRN